MCYTAKQYNNRIRKLQELEAEKKAIEAKITAVRDEIMADMGEVEKVETGVFRIHFTRISGKRFDTKRFRAEQAALYEAYQTATETRRFSYVAV